MAPRSKALLYIIALLLFAVSAGAQQTRNAKTALTAGGIGGVWNNVPGDDNVINVLNYGAKGDGVTDDNLAIQSAINAAEAAYSNSNKIIPDVFLPPATYKSNFPLWINAPINFHGSSNTTTFITSLGSDGILVAPSGWTSSLNPNGAGAGKLWSAPLVGSVGQSMNFDPTNAPWGIDLQRVANTGATSPGVIPYNGLAQMAVEFWSNVQDTTNGDQGNWLTTSGNGGAEPSGNNYGFGPVQINYQVGGGGTTDCTTVTMNIANTQQGSGGCVGSYTSNAVHFTEVDYDGAHTCGYIDGTRLWEGNATGAVFQGPYHAMWVGEHPNTPLSAGGAGGPLGQMFGLRISNTARHSCSTASYTPPTAALSNDANTLNLVNGVHVNSAENTPSKSGPFVQEDHTGAWLTMMTNEQIGFLFNVAIANLAITSAEVGIDFFNVQESTITNVSSTGFYAGLNTFNNAFFDNFYSSQFNADGHGLAGAYIEWPSVLCSGCTVATPGYYGIVDYSGVDYANPYINMSSVTQAGLVSTPNAQFQFDTINNSSFTNENNSVGPSIVSNGARLVLNGAGLTTNGSSTFPTLELNGGIIVVNGGLLTTTGAAMPYVGSETNTGQVQLNQTQLNFANLTTATSAIAASGITYDVHDAGTGSLTGTTAGTATWTFPTFSTYNKTINIQLSGFQNATSTAQLFMLPASISSMGSINTISGTCSGIFFQAGSNSGCTGNAAPYPCCTGSGAGTCNTDIFGSLPTAISGTQTGVCQATGK